MLWHVSLIFSCLLHFSSHWVFISGVFYFFYLSLLGECLFYSIFYHHHPWKFQLISHSEEAIHFRKTPIFYTYFFFSRLFLVHDNTNYMLPIGSWRNSGTFGTFHAWVAYTAYDPSYNESLDNVLGVWTAENYAENGSRERKCLHLITHLAK